MSANPASRSKQRPSLPEDYSDEKFPWNFYFNGELMPKWGACWGLAAVSSYLEITGNVGHRAVYDVYCSIDHVGAVESADPESFLFAVQEVLFLLLRHRDRVFASLAKQSYGEPQEIYSGLLEAAFRMREVASRDRCAFWTSGGEPDRGRLVGTMRRCQLPAASPAANLPPHLQQAQADWRLRHQEQVRRLHQLAQNGQLDKELRRRLHELRLA